MQRTGIFEILTFLQNRYDTQITEASWPLTIDHCPVCYCALRISAGYIAIIEDTMNKTIRVFRFILKILCYKLFSLKLFIVEKRKNVLKLALISQVVQNNKD